MSVTVTSYICMSILYTALHWAFVRDLRILSDSSNTNMVTGKNNTAVPSEATALLCGSYMQGSYGEAQSFYG